MRMLVLFFLSSSAILLNAQDGFEKKIDRTAWWQQARFGMFIHFGAYAVPGRGEWVKSVEKIPDSTYQCYVDEFSPVDFDAPALAKLAKKAGMKYAVLTAKHHEGFAMYDTRLSEYKITKNLPGRDIVREFLEAFRAEGLHVGVYFSLIDWHHPDYPHYGDNFHPDRENVSWKGTVHNWENYLTFMHGQIKELLTGYGKLDIMWFDFSYSEMTGQKWGAQKILEMCHKYQPEMIIDNRMGGDGATLSNDYVTMYGDFYTPEQGVPEKPIVDQQGRALPWETCLTLNNSWGYSATDHHWKTSELVIHTLVNCVSKGGNLLLNIGPDGRGNIPDESVAILGEVGRWMDKNHASVYGCGIAALDKPEWGRFTQNGKVLYAHLMYPHIGHINLKGYQDKVKKVRLLSSGTEVPWVKSWWGDHSTDNVFINIGQPTYLHYKLPDIVDTVFEIELK